MPTCRSCGEWTSEQYMRVFAPEEIERDGEVRACPKCTTVRERGEVRQARSKGAGYQQGEVQ